MGDIDVPLELVSSDDCLSLGPGVAEPEPNLRLTVELLLEPDADPVEI